MLTPVWIKFGLAFTGLISIVGCTTTMKSLPSYTPPALSSTAIGREANGVKVSVDPIYDKARAKEYFNMDALTYGIFPILIRAENTNPDTSFILHKENIKIVLNGANPLEVAAQIIDLRSFGVTNYKNENYSRDFAVQSVIWGPLGGWAMADERNQRIVRDVQERFIEGELGNKTLSTGQQAVGFVYFNVRKEQATQGGALKIQVFDTRNQQDTQLEIPIHTE
jgi:hypothetical protein